MKIIALTITAAWLAVQSVAICETTISTGNRYSYGANVGWVDWRGDTNTGAVVGAAYCSGYVYAANVGWIHLGDGAPTNGFAYSNSSVVDYGVNHDGAGNLRGCAYGANVGWIAFETLGGPRVNLVTGALDGYAYGANIGWMSLSNLSAFVQTITLNTGPDLDGDGIPDFWEIEQTGGTNILSGGSHDADDDGVYDIDEYKSDTDPEDDKEYLRMTDASASGGTNVAVTWASSEARLYELLTVGSLTGLPVWVDSGLGVQVPDPGQETTRNTTVPSGGTKFLRVRSRVPLSE